MSIYSDLPFAIARNPGVSFHLLSRLISVSTDAGRDRCYEILGRMRPMMVNFDLMAKLLQDYTALREVDRAGGRTVAEAVRNNALGEFLENCEAEIEDAEIQETGRHGGMVVATDSPCALAIQHVSPCCCHFKEVSPLTLCLSSAASACRLSAMVSSYPPPTRRSNSYFASPYASVGTRKRICCTGPSATATSSTEPQ